MDHVDGHQLSEEDIERVKKIAEDLAPFILLCISAQAFIRKGDQIMERIKQYEKSDLS